MKTLYYTVTKQLNDIDGFEETNGWKDIRVYAIKDNKMIVVNEIEVHNEDNSEEAILDTIEDDEVYLIQL
jgi:hypothetical protein